MYDLIIWQYTTYRHFFTMWIFLNRVYWCSMWARKFRFGPIDFKKLGAQMAPKVSIVNHDPVSGCLSKWATDLTISDKLRFWEIICSYRMEPKMLQEVIYVVHMKMKAVILWNNWQWKYSWLSHHLKLEGGTSLRIYNATFLNCYTSRT